MSDPTLPSFRYRLEQQPPRTDCGGVVQGASVRQFPVSKGIAGASMRLQPGCLRELHWHSTAAELGYVVSGSCRTTALSPDGAETATFVPGDVIRRKRGSLPSRACILCNSLRPPPTPDSIKDRSPPRDGRRHAGLFQIAE